MKARTSKSVVKSRGELLWVVSRDLGWQEKKGEGAWIARDDIGKRELGGARGRGQGRYGEVHWCYGQRFRALSIRMRLLT